MTDSELHVGMRVHVRIPVWAGDGVIEREQTSAITYWFVRMREGRMKGQVGGFLADSLYPCEPARAGDYNK